jgi:hypothetical protein
LAGKRTAIVLDKLIQNSADTLESMVAELAGERKTEVNRAEPSHWSRRFAASGKPMPAPKLRLS